MAGISFPLLLLSVILTHTTLTVSQQICWNLNIHENRRRLQIEDCNGENSCTQWYTGNNSDCDPFMSLSGSNQLCLLESNNGKTEQCTSTFTKVTTTVFPSCAQTTTAQKTGVQTSTITITSVTTLQPNIVPSTAETAATTSTQLCKLSFPAKHTGIQTSAITVATVTTTITLQPSPTCSKETINQPTPSPKLSTQSREASTALGVVMAILLLSLVGVVIGWVLTCIVMRRRETKQSYSATPAAVRLERHTTDKQRHHHQHPGHPGPQQPQCHITETNDDYATVIDNIDTVRYITNGNKEQQPRGPHRGPQPGVPPQERQPRVPQQGPQPGVSKQRGRESQQMLVDNDYHGLEEINEEKSELDNDYYLLEQEDEDEGEAVAADGVDRDYHVLEVEDMEDNGKEENRKKEGNDAAAAALYEIPIVTKNKSN